MKTALVIGAGPAGLMAAETLAQSGVRVVIADQKPSVGRKFLMAGKSGLNLTNAQDTAKFFEAYGDMAPQLRKALDEFGPQKVQDWAGDLGQAIFTGSTGRVFPKAMKASPLLRAWLARLDQLGVDRKTRWRWSAWDARGFGFDTPDGLEVLNPDICILALGGASWARLGSDGRWVDLMSADCLTPFRPSNVGVEVNWSPHMAPHLGKPLKNIALTTGHHVSRGEVVLSAKGIEGGGIYTISRHLGAAPLFLDLMPDKTAQTLATRLSRPRGKQSLSNFLRKAVALGPQKIALLQEFARPLPDAPGDLAQLIKALPVSYAGLRPMDEAISTAGGVAFDSLTDDLMIKTRPGVFVAGEMLDWDAPTGGYLLTACFATGRLAARGAVDWLNG